MKKHFKIITILVCVLFVSTKLIARNNIVEFGTEKTQQKVPNKEKTLKLNVATYNIRLETKSDQGERSWANRLPWARKIIEKYDFDIVGTQEGFKNQIVDLLADGKYDYIGGGRDDGIDKGEHSAILYKKDKFEVLDKGDFWFSETSDVPSKGWDATCCNRIASWGKFRDKETQKEFFFFNAHYDHQGKIAQLESSKLIVKKLKEIVNDDTPVFFTGDLNVLPKDEAIKVLLNSGLLLDSRHSSEQPVYGTEGTFHGYNLRGEMTKRIDYIFVSKGIRVAQYGVINDDMVTGKFSSDHFPVLIKAEL